MVSSIGAHPKLAIVREPGAAYRECISCHPLRDSINVERAREQHAHYCEALAELGLEVIKIPRDDMNADSCFVEDNAVVHGERALICRMAKESRQGEIDAVEEILKGFVKVRRATAPATVEGGDVVHFPDGLLSGVSQRTNLDGIAQLREWLSTEVDTIRIPDKVHLKSYVTYLGKDTFISTAEFAQHPALSGYAVIVVPKHEAYAADTLAIGDTVLMAKGRPHTHELVRAHGFEVVPMDVSEIEKCEGALTCLSILI